MTLYDKSQLAGYRNDHRNVNMDTLEQWGNLHWKHTWGGADRTHLFNDVYCTRSVSINNSGKQTAVGLLKYITLLA